MIYYSPGVTCWNCSTAGYSLRLGTVKEIRDWCQISVPLEDLKNFIGEVISQSDWDLIVDDLIGPDLAPYPEPEEE